MDKLTQFTTNPKHKMCVYREKNKYPGHSQQMNLLKKIVAIHYTYKSF